MPNEAEISEERLVELETAAKDRRPFIQSDHDIYEEIEPTELRTLIASHRKLGRVRSTIAAVQKSLAMFSKRFGQLGHESRELQGVLTIINDTEGE